MPLAFSRFLLHPVLGKITAAEAAEARDMWITERVLPAPEAERRTREILFLIREVSSGQLAGVCTVYPGPMGDTGRHYWHFRMFMRRRFRGVSGLPRFVLLASHRHLEACTAPGGERMHGVLITAENPGFRKHRFREHFAKQRPPWILFGTNPLGHDVFYRDFGTGEVTDRPGSAAGLAAGDEAAGDR